MKPKHSLTILFLLVMNGFLGCTEDDVEKAVILQSTSYKLHAISNSNISGKATFTQEDNGSTHVLIELEGAFTKENSAYIRFNRASVGGNVAITLKACECAISNTTITKLDNGTPITYDGLLALNGHISIHKGDNPDDPIVAVADIGSNVAE